MLTANTADGSHDCIEKSRFVVRDSDMALYTTRFNIWFHSDGFKMGDALQAFGVQTNTNSRRLYCTSLTQAWAQTCVPSTSRSIYHFMTHGWAPNRGGTHVWAPIVVAPTGGHPTDGATHGWTSTEVPLCNGSGLQPEILGIDEYV